MIGIQLLLSTFTRLPLIVAQEASGLYALGVSRGGSLLFQSLLYSPVSTLLYRLYPTLLCSALASWHLMIFIIVDIV